MKCLWIGRKEESLLRSELQCSYAAADFTKLLNLVEEHDPDRKFANAFTRWLFGRGEQEV
jgi:hypothetical protein